MNLPKFSVITVSYNQGEFIQKTIESVLQQSYPNFEHIVVDGGSTDNTIEILKSYPHLKWTSEKDRGQSHALNKGFSRATGDIIAWINSDDWYAPGVFHDVAYAMKDCHVVMGQAEKTDRSGVPNEVIKNVPRTFFDLWRYWVPYAWVAQPSVFFTRASLEAAKLPNGNYVDEDLYFTMDYDLWIRISKDNPFTRHIPRTLSYFRLYDENKTGAWPLATQRECSRVFRRYENKGQLREQRLSVVIPADAPSDLLKKTIISLTTQTVRDFEIVIAGFAKERSAQKELREFCFALSEVVEHMTIRYVSSYCSDLMPAINAAFVGATSPLVSVLLPGDEVSQDYVRKLVDYFSRDVMGVVLFTDSETEKMLYPDGKSLNVAAPLMMRPAVPRFCARRHAWLEMNSSLSSEHPLALFRTKLLSIMFKNWAVTCDSGGTIHFIETSPSASIPDWGDADTVSVIQAIQNEANLDPFFEIRKAMRNPEPLFALLK